MLIRIAILRALAMSWVTESVVPSITTLNATSRRNPRARFIRHQPNGFHSKINFGSTVSAAKRAMNIAAAMSTPK